jgi:hypothetical protein
VNPIHFATLRTSDGHELCMTVDMDMLPFAMARPGEDDQFSDVVWDLTSAFEACRLMVLMGLWCSTDKPSDPIPHLFTTEATVNELAALIETALVIENDTPQLGETS